MRRDWMQPDLAHSDYVDFNASNNFHMDYEEEFCSPSFESHLNVDNSIFSYEDQYTIKEFENSTSQTIEQEIKLFMKGPERNITKLFNIVNDFQIKTTKEVDRLKDLMNTLLISFLKFHQCNGIGIENSQKNFNLSPKIFKDNLMSRKIEKLGVENIVFQTNKKGEALYKMNTASTISERLSKHFSIFSFPVVNFYDTFSTNDISTNNHNFNSFKKQKYKKKLSEIYPILKEWYEKWGKRNMIEGTIKDRILTAAQAAKHMGMSKKTLDYYQLVLIKAIYFNKNIELNKFENLSFGCLEKEVKKLYSSLSLEEQQKIKKFNRTKMAQIKILELVNNN